MNPRMLSPALCSLLITALLLLAATPSAATAPGAWGNAEPIETDNVGNATSPQVALDAGGNAVAVWYQSDGIRSNIWSNRYVPDGGWGTSELIETGNGTADYPHVAVDGSGNAFAVWSQSDGARTNILANRYVAGTGPGTGWGAAALVETNNSGGAIRPKVSVDASGNAIAVWSQSDGTRYNIWANRYTAGAGWGAASLIETDDAGDAYSPQVAAYGNGSAIAVWYQHDGTRYNVLANGYAAGAGWGAASLLETDNAGDAVFAQVAVDGSGNALAVWHAWDGGRNNVWANRYAAGMGWGAPGLIQTGNAFSAVFPQVAFDGSGNAIAVWSQWDGSRYDTWGNRYVAGAGWGNGTVLQTVSLGASYGQQVAVDRSGNAVVVWQQSDYTRNNIWATRYIAGTGPGTGWGLAALIETDNAGSAQVPGVAVDGSGDAVAVWMQNDGTRFNIVANRFVEDYPPALTLSGFVRGASTNVSTAWVAGVTEPGAAVSVNGVAVTVAPNGSFGVQLALAPGPNVINVSAWDALGNRARAYGAITFNDPVPALTQGLAAAETNLTAAQAALASTQASLATTQSSLAAAVHDLDNAEARVSALEADANATQAQLGAAQANLTAAQAQVVSLQAAASANQAEVRAARADLANAQARMVAMDARQNATQADLAAAEAQSASASAQAAGASGQVGTALLVGLAGVALGAVGLALGLRGRGRTALKDPSGSHPAEPKLEPPK